MPGRTSDGSVFKTCSRSLLQAGSRENSVRSRERLTEYSSWTIGLFARVLWSGGEQNLGCLTSLMALFIPPLIYLYTYEYIHVYCIYIFKCWHIWMYEQCVYNVSVSSVCPLYIMLYLYYAPPFFAFAADYMYTRIPVWCTCEVTCVIVMFLITIVQKGCFISPPELPPGRWGM